MSGSLWCWEVKYPKPPVRLLATSCLAPVLIYSVCNPCCVPSWAPVTLYRSLMHWLSLCFPFFNRYDVDSKSANLSKHVSAKTRLDYVCFCAYVLFHCCCLLLIPFCGCKSAFVWAIVVFVIINPSTATICNLTVTISVFFIHCNSTFPERPVVNLEIIHTNFPCPCFFCALIAVFRKMVIRNNDMATWPKPGNNDSYLLPAASWGLQFKQSQSVCYLERFN